MGNITVYDVMFSLVITLLEMYAQKYIQFPSTMEDSILWKNCWKQVTIAISNRNRHFWKNYLSKLHMLRGPT